MTTLKFMEKGLDFELCTADRSPGSKRLHPASDQCFRYRIYSSLCFLVNKIRGLFALFTQR